MVRVCALIILVAACGSSESAGTSPDAGAVAFDAPPPPVDAGALRLDIGGETVRAVLPLPRGALLFREPIGGGLVEHDVRRTLTWIDARGATAGELRAADDELFLDVVTHPSGEATLLVATGETCTLRRLGPTGALLDATPLADPDLTTDPTDTTWGDPVIPWRVGACQPTEIRETARLAADGEDVVTVNRGGSSGTVLFRHARAAAGFTRTLRRPLFPRFPAPLPTGIVASHRVLRSSHWSFVPRVVVDDAGRARVLLVFGGGTPREIYDDFAEAPVGEQAIGVLLTVDRDGALVEARALPRELLGAQRVTEIEGLRWLRGGVVLVGRNAPAPLPDDGAGWDGFIVHIVDGEAAPRLAARVDLPAAAALSDVATLGASGWLVAGRSSYWQNPRGASISEEAVSELVVLDGAGAIVRQITLPQGPRHNGALSIAPAGDGTLLVGGLANGPGSHSADGDPTRLAADGWVQRAVIIP